MRGERVELGRIDVIGAEGRARELDDHALHAHTEAEARDGVLAGIADGPDLALDSPVSEATRDDDAGQADERLEVLVSIEALRVDPVDAHIEAERPACLLQRLGYGPVRLRPFDDLAAQADVRTATAH